MNLTKVYSSLIIIVICLVMFLPSVNAQGPGWYQSYNNGNKAMERNDWNEAIQKFKEALQVKDKDKNKQRAFGAIFIEYYPHRGLGIAYYHSGQIEFARKEISISLQQNATGLAREYMEKINQGNYQPPTTIIKQPVPVISVPKKIEKPVADVPPEVEVSVTSIGERLSIAVLPFVSRGFSGEIGDMDIFDKMITGLIHVGRFKVIERAQLEKIVQEQKLGLTGILDATTAAEVGRGIGVDAVILGSVTRAQNSLSIDARLIDTETAAIICAKDAYSSRIDMQDISKMVNDLAIKIKDDFPMVNGYIINIRGDKYTLDIGLKDGLKKGMKCTVYREGESIVHPVSGEVLGKIIDELCEIQITDIYDGYSIAKITKDKGGMPRKLDKVVTK